MQLIVRARQKPFDEIPRELLCCNSGNISFREQSRDEIDVLPETLHVDDLECCYCGNIVRNVQCMNLRRRIGDKTFIIVSCYEFDEGLTQ